MTGIEEAAAIVSIASAVAGTAVSAIGAEKTASAESQAAAANAQIAAENQQAAQQNAAQASMAGEQQAAISQQRTRARMGGIIASEAAGGIDVNSGSAQQVQASNRAIGLEDALTIKSNAARQAYGYEVQGTNFGAQASLDTAQAANASQAGDITAASTILGGASTASSNYAKFLQSGAL
jgi:hypothetical protein